MKYRRLGNGGMKVSAVSLGGWINFGGDVVARDLNRQIVETAYDNGINFFDLADAYERGEAEKEMGSILKQYPRHTLVVSSKLFWPMSDDVNDRGLSRKHIMESIDKTLQRLDMDYIDIYFCHRADPETPMYETAKAMSDLVDAGKVLYWGTSEWPAAKIVEAYELCLRYGWNLPQVEQPNYSMLYRERVENEILPATEPRGVGLVTFSPLAQGMLTGKYDDGVPEGSRFGREDWARERVMTEANAQRVRNLKPIADDLGISRAQLALAWNLRQYGVSSVITGATRAEHIENNIKAADVELMSDVIEIIDQALTID
ncbi:MAG: aldo/keto reductase family protein [Anaerolineaceae bacterium]|nr:aldo/keto reductase family protein [Anaerolineaceae bacterium]